MGVTDKKGIIRTLPLALDDDALLAKAAAEGHAGALRAIWDRHSGMVRGLLRRTIGPSAEIDDLVQETFLRLFRLVPRLRDADKLKSFLVGIAVRVAREELRRRRIRRWLTLAGPGDVPEMTAPRADLEAAEALARLYALLDRVDATTRVVFVLRFVEQMSTAEVAEVLDCSLATAKRRVLRATTKVQGIALRDPALASFVSHYAGAEPRQDAGGNEGTASHAVRRGTRDD